MSIAIAPPMMATGLVLIANAIALHKTDHPALMVIDLFLAIYILWHSIDRQDDDLPPPQHPLVGA